MTSGDWRGAGDGFAAYPALAGSLRLADCDAATIPDALAIAECAWPQVLANAGGNRISLEHDGHMSRFR